MTDPEQHITTIVQSCSALPEPEQYAAAKARLDALLADIALNPTGDEPPFMTADDLAAMRPASAPAAVNRAFDEFSQRVSLLQAARPPLAPAARGRISDAIKALVKAGHLNDNLVDKFRVPENRQFLDRALANAGNAWQLAMVANWALNTAGKQDLAMSVWRTAVPGIGLDALVKTVSAMLRFEHVTSLRDYRRQVMRHVPRISDSEFSALLSARWQDAIDQPSGREPGQDIPFVTPFTKQGDIEYSLYRHFLIPDLSVFMRQAVAEASRELSLSGKDIDILFSLPIVIQQAEKEIFADIKSTISDIIQSWAQQCRQRQDAVADALRITERLWNYRRAPAASDCHDPVENLIKGFNATIRNSFSHFSDINIAASCGDRIDPFDVADKFILFASVSNGQLDNLAEAHRHYCTSETNPAHWDNDAFFNHFLAANQRNDLDHIQGHFIVDKTRGCPAIPRIPCFHGIVLDLVLTFAFREFGENNLRQAGAWYRREKTPGSTD